MIIDEDAYIEHHGVKGMKWGVRRTFRRTMGLPEHPPPKPPLTKRQERAKKVRRQTLRDVKKAAPAAVAFTAAYTVASMAVYQPETLVRGAAFAGKKMRTPMKVAAKAAKGAKLIFSKDGKVKYFPPGTFTPGMFTDAGARALGAG